MAKAKQYIIEYGSGQWDGGTFLSTSRDCRKHGQEVLGTAGGGWVRAWDTIGWSTVYRDAVYGLYHNICFRPAMLDGRWARTAVSEARYTSGDGWYNSTLSNQAN